MGGYFFVKIMLKIKKDLNIKIISLVLAVVFSMHTTAYGRDLSSKSHLRIPLATNNVKTINRLQKTLAKQLMAEGKAALSVRELYPNAQNLAHAMADELELIAPEQYNELVNYWAVIWQGIYKNFPD